MSLTLSEEEKEWIAIAIRYAHHFDGPLEGIPVEVMVSLEDKFPLTKPLNTLGDWSKAGSAGF